MRNTVLEYMNSGRAWLDPGMQKDLDLLNRLWAVWTTPKTLGEGAQDTAEPGKTAEPLAVHAEQLPVLADQKFPHRYTLSKPMPTEGPFLEARQLMYKALCAGYTLKELSQVLYRSTGFLCAFIYHPENCSNNTMRTVAELFMKLPLVKGLT